MNRDRLEGKWKQLSGRMRERWGRLTDDRLSVAAGAHNQLAGRSQEKYGIFKEQAQRELKDFLHRHGKWNFPNR